jgi:hypothetical protein
MRNYVYVVMFFLLAVSMESESAKKSLNVQSKSFKSGQPISSKHSYTADNISPHLSWSKVDGAQSYAVICDDPDASRKDPWVHWVVGNIPAETIELLEGKVTGQEGMNDYHKIGWGGPNPPSGIHRYNFKVYALSDRLNGLSSKTMKKDLLKAMEGKILAEGSLMATYAAK